MVNLIGLSEKRIRKCNRNYDKTRAGNIWCDTPGKCCSKEYMYTLQQAHHTYPGAKTPSAHKPETHRRTVGGPS